MTNEELFGSNPLAGLGLILLVLVIGWSIGWFLGGMPRDETGKEPEDHE